MGENENVSNPSVFTRFASALAEPPPLAPGCPGDLATGFPPAPRLSPEFSLWTEATCILMSEDSPQNPWCLRHECRLDCHPDPSIRCLLPAFASPPTSTPCSAYHRPPRWPVPRPPRSLPPRGLCGQPEVWTGLGRQTTHVKSSRPGFSCPFLKHGQRVKIAECLGKAFYRKEKEIKTNGNKGPWKRGKLQQ